MSSGAELGQPLYGASVIDAQRRFWRKYLVLSGRASRSEFWWEMLVFVAVGLLLSLVNRLAVEPLPASPSSHAILVYSVKTGVSSTSGSLVNFIGGVSGAHPSAARHEPAGVVVLPLLTALVQHLRHLTGTAEETTPN